MSCRPQKFGKHVVPGALDDNNDSQPYRLHMPGVAAEVQTSSRATEAHLTYQEDDVAHFVRAAPYIELSRPERAIKFLERQMRIRSECFTGLESYPALQVEPLEFFYITAGSLGMLDRGSLEVMTTNLSWRGVVWGGWLALMRPSPDFQEVLANAAAHVEVLANAAAHVKDNLWAVQCALALIERRPPPPQLAAVNALAALVREAVSTMHIGRIPLRSYPTGDDLLAIQQEQRLVQEAYKSGGAERALQLLRGSRLHELTMPYARWRALRRAP